MAKVINFVIEKINSWLYTQTDEDLSPDDALPGISGSFPQQLAEVLEKKLTSVLWSVQADIVCGWIDIPGIVNGFHDRFRPALYNDPPDTETEVLRKIMGAVERGI